MSKLPNTRIRQPGPGIIEYIIITTLILVAAIGAVLYFGQSARLHINGMTQSLSGNDARGIITTKSVAENSRSSE